MSDGGRQDSTTSPNALNVRPSRRTEVQERRSRSIPDFEGRRARDSLPRSSFDRFATSYESRLAPFAVLLLCPRSLLMLVLLVTAANFTAYTELKKVLQKWQPEYPDGGLPAWQTSTIGLLSGAMGPFTNAPIDTIK